MVQIIKNEPTFFTDAKRAIALPTAPSAWDEIGKDERGFKTKLREHILLEEQNMLCAYCNQEIEADKDSSNTDHFKKRALFQNQTVDYENLLVSCKSLYHCENIKDNFGLSVTDYAKIIHIVFENPDDFFDYGIDGDILAKDGLNAIDKEKTEFTIEVFNLNNGSLQKDRAKIGESLKFYQDYDYEVDDILNDIVKYPSFIKNIYRKIGETA